MAGGVAWAVLNVGWGAYQVSQGLTHEAFILALVAFSLGRRPFIRRVDAASQRRSCTRVIRDLLLPLLPPSPYQQAERIADQKAAGRQEMFG